MWLAVLFTLVIAYSIYYFCFKPYNYWKNRGIIYEIPLPLVGNFGSTLIRKKHVSEINDYLYKKYSTQRCVGIYIFTRPALLIRDIDLVKRICQEEFEHFSERLKFFDKEFEKDVVLTNLTGFEWKTTRDFLNPIFQNTQLRCFFDLISDFADKFISGLVQDNESLVEIQLYDTLSTYENGVITSTFFGAKNGEQHFCQINENLRNIGVLEKLKLSLVQLLPCIAKLLSIRMCPASKTELFKKMVLEAIEERESDKTVDQDFAQSFIEAKMRWNQKGTRDKTELNVKFVEDEVETAKPENNKKVWFNEDLVAQSLIFLNSHSGLEPFIAASSSLAYELALNPDIQVKLQDEIDNTTQNVKNSKVNYETISQMEYLDCVVSECLRKWPPVYQVDRECVKNYFEVDLPIPDDEKIVIEKGTAVIIPIMAIQRDPNYFPDPLRFNPDRFNALNRDHIVPGSYIPFGCGPRKCIGSHLAILQMKMLFFHLLSKFDLVPTNNTATHIDEHPFKFDRPSAVCTVLGLKPRRVTSL